MRKVRNFEILNLNLERKDTSLFTTKYELSNVINHPPETDNRSQDADPYSYCALTQNVLKVGKRSK